MLKDLEANEVNATGQVADNGGILTLPSWILPLVLFGVFGYLAFKSMRGAAGAAGSIFSFGKSKARVIQGEHETVNGSEVTAMLARVDKPQPDLERERSHRHLDVDDVFRAEPGH